MSVDLIMGLGDDQMANQFVFSIPTGIPGGGDADAVSLRMEETFPMPTKGPGEYIIVYQGMQIIKTNMTDAMDKHFQITVRCDKSWAVYDDLDNWANNVYNGNNGTALSESATRTTVVVQALDGEKNVQKTFTFKYAKLQTLKASDFSHSDDGPTKLELNFIFGSMDVS
jgi:hypothetical protein